MTTVPGTYFTKEKLDADLKVDSISAGIFFGSDRLCQLGVAYSQKRKQYDKALAWYILGAMENHHLAYNNIGVLYHNGNGVPRNHLCAMKLFLKSAEQNYERALNNIGKLFLDDLVIPLDKNKALEWYCHGDDKAEREKLKKEGYHRSEIEKKKPLQQLILETEAILDTEKRKLEEKQHKTQKEIETLEQLKIIYKITDGGEDAWKNVPILLSEDYRRSIKPVGGLAVNYKNEIQMLRKQTQLLEQEKSISKIQVSQSESWKQEKTNFELRIKEKDNKISSLENERRILSRQQARNLNSLKQEKETMEKDKKHITAEMERLSASNKTLEQTLKLKEDVIVSLNSEVQTLFAANQGNEQGTNEMVETLKSLLQAKTNETELLKQNMERALDKEKKKNKRLQKEIEMLKQKQCSQLPMVTSSNNKIILEVNTSYTNMNGDDDDDDDVNNDINYDTEYGTEDSADDGSEDGDINYDTPNESEDAHNDLNYDDVNQIITK